MEAHTVDKLKLSAFVANELDSRESLAVKEHLMACPACREYAESLEREKREFLQKHPLETLDIHSEGSASASPNAGKNFFGSRQIYAAAAVFLVFFTVMIFYLMRSPEEDFRIKGDVNIKLFVKDKEGQIQARQNHVYSPGEYIQISYSCGSSNKFMLLSMDENGKTTVYYPGTGDSSVVLEKGRDIPMKNSILLDEYIGRELYIAVFSKEKIWLNHMKEKLNTAYSKAKDLDALEVKVNDKAVVKKIIIEKKEVH
jgi:hypothetical protein